MALLCIGCHGIKHGTAKSGKVNGTWVPVKEEIGGTALPAAALNGQKLTINDTAYTMVAESTDKGVIRYNGNKMDIYGREGVNNGKHFTAIYKYADDGLTICYNLAGDSYPEAFDTKGKPMFFLCVFKKDTK